MSCTIEGCGNQITNARGMCGKHYYRWRVHGSPYKTVKKSNGTLARYCKDVVMKHSGKECFTWPHSGDGRGYGAGVGVDGRRLKPHVFICELVNGPRPSPNHEAAHTCGKGHEACVSPHHLEWKTRSENQQDRKNHGTYQYGENNPSCVLTKEQVLEILSLKGKLLQREIAEIYGTTRRNIGNIHTGRSWKELTGVVPDKPIVSS